MSPYVVLRVVSKLLIPLIFLYGFYVHFHGEYSPGGGFAAGVVVGVGVILYALIFGLQAARKAVPPYWARIGMALGALIFAGVGFISLFMGGNYLDYTVLDPNRTYLGQHIGIVAVEFGVLVSVTAVIIAIFYAFAGRERPAGEAED
ncbi:Na(+)/H(+) antiporter subunit B [Alkalicaulis satelles]|uniref:Na(+)/H(+) antiporter subunit B n=1 Tax=Alkalicaulis satelles TaxID=2609175 RepID=A0A5M6ZI66_9PROT|nr:Na(+)/H(+) antiporter subunit B [Alkalicaulis satelles]KAA5804513.1 Na(+)/H(+) antiporter subunit B [Alkalicaulis satelles]